MKNFILIILFVGFLSMISSCSGSKYSSGATHHRGVNNSGYQGY